MDTTELRVIVLTNSEVVPTPIVFPTPDKTLKSARVVPSPTTSPYPIGKTPLFDALTN